MTDDACLPLSPNSHYICKTIWKVCLEPDYIFSSDSWKMDHFFLYLIIQSLPHSLSLSLTHVHCLSNFLWLSNLIFYVKNFLFVAFYCFLLFFQYYFSTYYKSFLSIPLDLFCLNNYIFLSFSLFLLSFSKLCTFLLCCISFSLFYTVSLSFYFLTLSHFLSLPTFSIIPLSLSFLLSLTV